MPSVGIDDGWHTAKAPRRKVTGSLSGSYSGLTIYASCTITQSKTASGYSPYSDTIMLYIDGTCVATASVPMVPGGTRSLSGSLGVGAGNHSVSVRMKCGDSDSCPLGYNTNPKTVGSVSFNVPVPWSDPVLATNVKNSSQKIKPDGTLTVSWTAARAGTGNRVDHYSVNYKYCRNGTWSGRTAITSNTSGTSYAINNLESVRLFRVDDLIATDVDTYIVSSTAGHASGWYGARSASNNNITIYKDGILWVKDNSGTKHEATMAYVKDTNGTKRKVRYLLVKDTSGAQHIIDIYTTHYE